MAPYPTPPENEHTLIGSVYERVPSKAQAPILPNLIATSGTGFPAVKRREASNGAGSGRRGQSAFMRGRNAHATDVSASEAMSLRGPPIAQAGPSSIPPAKLQSLTARPSHNLRMAGPAQQADDWRSAVERDNELRVANMSEEEREEEKRVILERFGSGIGDVLKKARAARTRVLIESKESDASIEEGMPFSNIASC
jgi:RNA polymerase II-associated protein 1